MRNTSSPSKPPQKGGTSPCAEKEVIFLPNLSLKQQTQNNLKYTKNKGGEVKIRGGGEKGVKKRIWEGMG